jgi:hypothetical protein
MSYQVLIFQTLSYELLKLDLTLWAPYQQKRTSDPLGKQ